MKKRMKKGKITMIITIGISCFALVLVMFMQFKIVNETDITSIENMREAELRTELANWKSKYEETNQKYEETTQKIEVTLRENKSEEIARINGDDLLVIVNSLKMAGAEAISINDQRIINMSDIVDINETFIKVNGQRILAPYVIKAIGNSSYLETALTGNGGHVDEMKKIGQNISIEKMNKVKILKYDGEIKTKYIQ